MGNFVIQKVQKLLSSVTKIKHLWDTTIQICTKLQQFLTSNFSVIKILIMQTDVQKRADGRCQKQYPGSPLSVACNVLHYITTITENMC